MCLSFELQYIFILKLRTRIYVLEEQTSETKLATLHKLNEELSSDNQIINSRLVSKEKEINDQL